MSHTHSFTISIPVSEAYEIASTLGGMRSWWTSDISGDPSLGGELHLRFDDITSWSMRVSELKHNKWIIWTITESTLPFANAWQDITFSLRFVEIDPHTTTLILEYEDRPDIHEHYAERWKESVASLTLVCETGKGIPANPKRNIPSRPHRTNYPSA